MRRSRRRAWFIPFQGCSRRCVYCDQVGITGARGAPDADEIARALGGESEPVEVCFFGGSFGRLDPRVMGDLLDAARCAPNGSKVTFSTYPGDFDGENGDRLLDAISRVDIGTIELGVPTLDADVLRACGRDDDAATIVRAISRVRDAGHHIGVQMMTGLPMQSVESAARDIRALAALMPSGAKWHLRIYPCLVLAGTVLEEMYARGEHSPQTLDEAIASVGALLSLARAEGFVPIRIGLHDSASLRGSVVAGPYHPAFGELAMSEEAALTLAAGSPRGPWTMPRSHISILTGHGRRGARRLAELVGMTVEDVLRSVEFV